MKPLNRDEPGCNYTSSNCVIWQGPDIPCIKICKGDSVSDVVFKLATELCDLLADLDISSFDLSCLNITSCPPKSFHELIQLLIKTICELQAATGVITPITIPATDELPVATMFQYTNQYGDLVTTMPIPEYVTAIGNATNDQEQRLDSVETTVAVHTDQIQTLQQEVSDIPTTNIPQIIPSCVAPPVPTDQSLVLVLLEQQFCQLQGATGDPTQIFAAIQTQCVNLANSPRLSGNGGNMSTIPGWDNALLNLAGAFNNMWLSYCDMRAAVLNIQANCCPSGCDGISLNMNAIVSGTNLVIYLTGAIPIGFADCLSQGAFTTISDTTGGSITTYIPLITNINNLTGFIVSLSGTPINLASNINIHIDVCLDNPTTGSNCQSVLNYTVVNVSNCPVMVYSPTVDTVGYNGISIAGTNTYEVELWDNTGTVLIATQSQMVTFPAPIVGTFSGLIINSLFRARVIVTNALGVATSCPFEPIALIPTVILPVNLGSAASFSVLAGAGIGNAGASTFIGDVGSDPTNTVIGITAPDVTGTLYTSSNPAVIAAKADLVIAIADASGRTPVTTLPADAIGGTVITAGIYDTPGGTIDVTGGVTFDGGGDANAVFILNAATTLVFAAGTTVTLINGASFANIFWNIGTTVDVGAGSIVKGIILADGNIVVSAGSDIQGAILANTGLVDIDTSNIHIS